MRKICWIFPLTLWAVSGCLGFPIDLRARPEPAKQAASTTALQRPVTAEMITTQNASKMAEAEWDLMDSETLTETTPPAVKSAKKR